MLACHSRCKNPSSLANPGICDVKFHRVSLASYQRSVVKVGKQQAATERCVGISPYALFFFGPKLAAGSR